MPVHPPGLPPIEVCHRARESRDARFDGLFFTAVRSTRVYCRSVCPAPTCHRTSVVYYASAAAAQAAGYRPCLRCRPELAPGPNVDDDADLRRALARRPGLRLPGAWDGFEAVIAELFMQTDEPDAARDLLLRVISRHGPPVGWRESRDDADELKGPLRRSLRTRQ